MAFVNCTIECADMPIQQITGMCDCLDTYRWNLRSPFVMHGVDPVPKCYAESTTVVGTPPKI